MSGPPSPGSERPPLATVDEVRESLRRLGYLETPLDRFVLADAGPGSVLRASLRAAARVGLAGGVLAGVALTLGAAALDQRLRAQPADLALLAVYLVAALTLALALLALLAGLGTAWAGRRFGRAPHPRLSHGVALALGLAGLLYFGLWWRSHAHALAPVGQVAAALFGLGLVVLLGRFGSLAAVAVLAAAGVGQAVPDAHVEHRRLTRLLLAAAAGFALVLAGLSFASSRPAPPPDFAVVPTGLRLRVLAVDGLDRGLFEKLAARGELPHLSAILAEGAHGVLRAEPEQVPAIVWTTVATGRGPEAHGIQSAGTRRLAGMSVPVGEAAVSRPLAAAADVLRITRAQPASSVLRTVKAFWNVASDKGLRVGIVNWWATWPADALNGYVVTERAFFKLEKGGPAEREAHPAGVLAKLTPLRAAAAAEPDRGRALDRFHFEAAGTLREAYRPDLEAVYLPGLDIATMQLLGDASAVDLASLDARLEAVRAHYRFLDALLGEARAGLGAGEVLVLAADPGRFARRSARPAEGLVAFAGSGVAALDLGPVSERDLAPTVLHLLGLPVSRELDGRALEQVLRAELRARNPLRQVESYGRRPPAGPAESSFDRAMLDELKSLGYIR